jgi:hypothetical protein
MCWRARWADAALAQIITPQTILAPITMPVLIALVA